MIVPALRIHALNQQPIRKDGEFVLYWMIANRRPSWNGSLDRANEHAQALQKPLVVLEALRNGYQWASDRLHHFILQGMKDNQRAFSDSPAFYYPYEEDQQNAGRGLLAALSKRACVIVTDDFPAFMFPRMTAAAGRKVQVLLEKVDSNGLYPMHDTDRVFTVAHSFRRHLQKTLLPHLEWSAKANPFSEAQLPVLETMSSEILERWPLADMEYWTKGAEVLASRPIDHDVSIVEEAPGGIVEAERRFQRFLQFRLPRYADERNEVDEEAASGLSAYLHFGHISTHRIFAALVEREGWTLAHVADKPNGKRHGWWGMSEASESFLDELITWREIGFNMCALRDDYDRYDALPEWAKTTLAEHSSDRREYVYCLEEFEHSRTHDKLWNAAQRQLVTEGRIHNYLRMLWGKKILEWTSTPQEALAVMVELNNKYALDGRDPNSYSGIFWVLGRYDRAWGPVRPIFGKIRFMSSESTARKLKVQRYLRTYDSLPLFS